MKKYYNSSRSFDTYQLKSTRRIKSKVKFSKKSLSVPVSVRPSVPSYPVQTKSHRNRKYCQTKLLDKLQG